MSKLEVRNVCAMCKGLCWHNKYVNKSVADPLCKFCHGTSHNPFTIKDCFCLSQQPILTLVQCGMCDGKGYIVNDIEAFFKLLGKDVLTRLLHTMA